MTFFGGTIADSGLLNAGSTGLVRDVDGWLESLWSERRRDFIVVGVAAVEGRLSSSSSSNYSARFVRRQWRIVSIWPK